MSYTLTSTKGARKVDGSLTDAIRAAVAMNDDLQPAYGVSVDGDDGATIASIGEDADARYLVRAIGSEHCDSLGGGAIVASDDFDAAKTAANAVAGYGPYGVGIEDTDTGEIDVGFGLGVPCPDETD